MENGKLAGAGGSITLYNKGCVDNTICDELEGNGLKYNDMAKKW